jgi:Carboxypeptidase regulatory-like domain
LAVAVEEKGQPVEKCCVSTAIRFPAEFLNEVATTVCTSPPKSREVEINQKCWKMPGTPESGFWVGSTAGRRSLLRKLAPLDTHNASWKLSEDRMTQQRVWVRCLIVSLVAVVLCCAGNICFAQLDRGSIAGTVTDPSGSAVAGARVTVTNTAMGTQSSTVTTGVGAYTIPELPAGDYSVTVNAPGFKELIRNGITVSVEETATIDLKLAVGQTTTSITVTANAPLLQTDSAQNNVEVTTTNLNELPFNVAGVGAVRDPMAFAALVPGSIAGGWNDIHIEGSPATTYRVFMDGLDDTSAVKAAISDEQQPSVESLGSESVMINDYSARFGESGGGIFNYTSKSGTNRLHGTAFNYLENEDLDAGQPFNYTTSGNKTLPVQRQLDFGASLGGPVFIPHVYNGHDRTFFFFAYEEYHNTQTLNDGLITVPTQAYLTGDLSSNLGGPILDSTGTPVLDCLGRPMINGTIYNPATTRKATCTDGSTKVVRDPFPDNFIGAPSTWDPVASAVLKYMPAPSGATADALTNNYPNLEPNNKYQYLTSIKLDHYIGQKWHFSGYYMHEIGNKDNATDGINGTGGQTRWNHTPAPQLYLNADYTVTPNLVLHAGFDFTRHDALQDSAVQNFNTSTLGLSNAESVAPGGSKTFPIFSGITVNNAGVPNMGINNAPFIDDNYYETGSAIWVHGSHTLDFGGDFRHQLFGTHNDQSPGSYGFARDQTSLPSSQGQNLYGATIGDGFASFVLGQLNNANIGNDNVQWFHRVEGSFYGQDTWKLTRKVTINIGVRWDLEQMEREQYLRETQFSRTVVNPSAGGLMGGTEYEGNGTGRCNCIYEKFYPWMVQPRVGFSYQLDAKTVLHAASGFYSGPQLFMNEEGYSNQGFGFNQVFLNAPSFGIPAGLPTGTLIGDTLKNGVPFTAAQLTATNFDPGAFPNAGQINSPPNFIVPNNGRSPRFLQSTIGVEREIARNLSVNVSFIDIRGVWLNSDDLTNTTNELTPAMLSQKYGLNVTNPTDFALLTSPISSTSYPLPYPTFPTNQILAQALRPFPQFGGIGDYYEHDGNWWYDALQVKVTKRLSNGLSGGLGYNFSKNLGTAGSTNQPTFTTLMPIQDPSLPAKSQKTYEGIDQPQALNFYFNYEVPRFSFDQNGWKGALLSGWTADGIFHYQSGFPLQVPNSTSTLDSVTFANSAGNGQINVFANRVPGQPLFLHSLNKHDASYALNNQPFLNAAAWTNPAFNTLSTSKPFFGNYRQPRQPNEELGFGKVIPFKENVSFSLRCDFFNVFNRWVYPNFNNSSNPFGVSNGEAFGVFGSTLANAGGNYAPRSGEIVARIQF